MPGMSSAFGKLWHFDRRTPSEFFTIAFGIGFVLRLIAAQAGFSRLDHRYSRI